MEKYTDLKKERICLSNAIPLSKPFTLLIEPTSICNFSCVQCFHSKKNFHEILPKGFLEFDKYQKVLNDLCNWPGEKLKVIRFIGFGEPMLHKQLGDMVILARDMNVADRLEITSNGSLLTEKIAEKLLLAQLDYLRISIYAATQERHETITQSKISINRIWENIHLLKEMRGGRERPFIYIKMLDSFDTEENKRFFDMYSSLADEISLEQPHNWLEEKSCEKERIICPQPFKMMSMHFNGDIVMCDPDWQGNTCMGNAFREGIRNIWEGAKLREFWQLQLDGHRKENLSCKRCSFLNYNYVMDNIDDSLGKKLGNT